MSATEIRSGSRFNNSTSDPARISPSSSTDKIEAASSALQEELDHIVAVKSEGQFVAGHAGLCDYEHRLSDLQTVSDKSTVFQQPLRCEVLAEYTPGECRAWQFFPPVFIVFGRIGVNGLLRSAMYGEVRLAVAGEIQAAYADRALHRFLEDGRLNGDAFQTASRGSPTFTEITSSQRLTC